MIVAISLNNSNSTATTISTVTYNTTSNLTRIGFQVNSNRRLEYWSLANAPAVTANVVITPTAMANGRVVGTVAGVITFTGVDSNTPVGTPTFATGNNNTPAVTIASNPNQLVLGTVSTSGNITISSVGGSETQQWNLNSGTAGSDSRGLGTTATGATSVALSETLSAASQWTIGALPILGPATGNLCATPGKDGVGTVAGVVNAYYAPSTNVVLAPGAASVTLAAGVGANTNITAGDLLLIMQMQDASINSSNDQTYGAGTGTAGVLTGPGSGYTSLPTITITPTDGQGSGATAIVNDLTVGSISAGSGIGSRTW